MADALMLLMLFLLLGANSKGDYKRLLQSQNSLCKVWIASSPNFKKYVVENCFLIFLVTTKAKQASGVDCLPVKLPV